MKAVAIDSFGGPEKLKLVDIETPTPQAGEVLVEVSHASVNPVDYKIREGYLAGAIEHKFPLIPGWDAAGTIKEVGSGVTDFAVGQKVYAYCRKPVVQWGAYAEYIALEAKNVARMPSNLTFAEASAVPLAALTAWQALVDFAKLTDGQTVLVHAGAGGVGSYAIQFARYLGARVFTTATEKNHGYVTELGANRPIDYTKVNFAEVVKELEPGGVDVVFDCAGGSSLTDSYGIVKPGGHLVSIVETPSAELAAKHRLTAGYWFVSPSGEQLKNIAGLIEQGDVRIPRIEILPLRDVALAHQKSESRRTQGKIVLAVKE